MNINRFLSRREKDGNPHRRQKSRDKSADKKSRPVSSEGQLSGLFKVDPQKKDQISKVQNIRQRLAQSGFSEVDDGEINSALASKHADGDVDRAFEFMLLLLESAQGVIKPYNSSIHMQGAKNRHFVTCYLDSLLFAMFARLGSFEPILTSTFEDEPRKRLATLIRLWVNMLRTGMLIQTDITKDLQEALAACGWEAAAQLEQQDTSEAFSFITETLQLPLLTLKMDLYHTGKEDAEDDHKFVHERLLEVAVPDDTLDGRTIQLEDCLENYFNNRVEVVRRLERSNTMQSRPSVPVLTEEGEPSVTRELPEFLWTSPEEPSFASTSAPTTPIVITGRNRATSIIRRRVIPEEEATNDTTKTTDSDPSIGPSKRKGSIRKEVLMPAWQFFNLIPWYTKSSSPSTDADVAAHFSRLRPVLGICLKRYQMSADGHASRKGTFVDIPIDVGLPQFIQEDMVDESGSLLGSFKLSLQSIICHRGNSVHAGHYISIVRGTTKIADGDYSSARKLSDEDEPPEYPEDRWIKFDDLSESARVSYVDIKQALKEEMPYLLFYQVQPIFDSSPSPELDILPPSYVDSGVALKILQSTPEPSTSERPLSQGYFDPAADESTDPSIRHSSELDGNRNDVLIFGNSVSASGEVSDGRRDSATNTENSIGSLTDIASSGIAPESTLPAEETTAQRLSRAAARFSRAGSRTHSRAASEASENRLSASFSRLALMRSKDFQTKAADASKEAIPPTESRRNSIALDEPTLKVDEGIPSRSKSIMGKRRDKSKGPPEKVIDQTGQSHQHHHHHSRDKSKGKNKEIPDRECEVM